MKSGVTPSASNQLSHDSPAGLMTLVREIATISTIFTPSGSATVLGSHMAWLPSLRKTIPCSTAHLSKMTNEASDVESPDGHVTGTALHQPLDVAGPLEVSGWRRLTDAQVATQTTRPGTEKGDVGRTITLVSQMLHTGRRCITVPLFRDGLSDSIGFAPASTTFATSSVPDYPTQCHAFPY